MKKATPLKNTGTPSAATRKRATGRPTSDTLRSTDARSVDTRLALMRAAETLMTAKGIDAVSLREVSAAAGQANNSSVLYHFGNRDALIDAILERHSTPIHLRWDSQLDLIERHSLSGLRPLVEMLVIENANKLDDPDGGFAYLSLCAQLLMSPVRPLIDRPVGRTDVVARLTSMMANHRGIPADVIQIRMERVLHVLYPGLLTWHRYEKEKLAHFDREAFISELVDAICGIIQQPLSSMTSVLFERHTRPTEE